MRFSKILYVVLLYANTVLLVYLMAELLQLVPDRWMVDEATQSMLWAAWIVSLALSIVLQVIDAAILLRRSDFYRLVRSMMVIKAAAIPYFIVNFVVLAAFMVILIGGSRGVGIILIWVPFALTYVVFLPTSIYSFATLLFAHRYHLVGTAGFVLHVILQAVFVLDLLSTAILWVKNRHYPRSTEAPRVSITYPPFQPADPEASVQDGAAVGAVEASA
jgi:hypothetical protein